MYLVSTYILFKAIYYFCPIKIATNRTKEKFMTLILILGGLNLEDWRHTSHNSQVDSAPDVDEYNNTTLLITADQTYKEHSSAFML